MSHGEIAAVVLLVFTLVGVILVGWYTSPVGRFCDRCGELIVRKSQADGFDRRTGRVKFRYWRGCPRVDSNGFHTFFE